MLAPEATQSPLASPEGPLGLEAGNEPLCGSGAASRGCWPVTVYAVEMGLSPHTVRNHSTNLRRKLDVRSSLEAVIAAVRLGVLTLDEDRRETNVS